MPAVNDPEAIAIVDFNDDGNSDLNGDSKGDLLWHNTATGAVVFWFMDGSSASEALISPGVPLEWRIVPGPMIEQNPLCKASG